MRIERIPRDLMLTFDAIRPYEFDESFFDRLGSGDVDVRGLSRERVMRDIAFLQDRGALVLIDVHGYGRHFALTPEGREYRREIAIETVSVVGRSVAQLATGACGGLAVFLLSRFLG